MLALDATDKYQVRREQVFLLLAGLFLSALTMMNVIGITRFIELGPMTLAIGVLPYPLTFLCTDIVCELYGKRRATFMVTVGLLTNVFLLAVVSLAHALPSVPTETMPPWQVLDISNNIILPSGEIVSGKIELFSLIYACTTGAVFASMAAYVTAQYCDVHLFHFWKRLTKGKHLWLRNNFSTLISQGVDATMVISITFGAAYLAGELTMNQLLVLMGSNYLFKMCVALADTIPFYLSVNWLSRYLGLTEGATEVPE